MEELSTLPLRVVKRTTSVTVSVPSTQSLSSTSSSSEFEDSEGTNDQQHACRFNQGGIDVYSSQHGPAVCEIGGEVKGASAVRSDEDSGKLSHPTPLVCETLVQSILLAAASSKPKAPFRPPSQFANGRVSQDMAASLSGKYDDHRTGIVRHVHDESTVDNISKQNGSESYDSEDDSDYSDSGDADESGSDCSDSDDEYAELLSEMPMLLARRPSGKEVPEVVGTMTQEMLDEIAHPPNRPDVTPIEQECDGVKHERAPEEAHSSIAEDILEDSGGNEASADGEDSENESRASYDSSDYSETEDEDVSELLGQLPIQVHETNRTQDQPFEIPTHDAVHGPSPCFAKPDLPSTSGASTQTTRLPRTSEKGLAVGNVELIDSMTQDDNVDSSYCSSSYMSDSVYDSSEDENDNDVINEMVQSPSKKERHGANSGGLRPSRKLCSSGASTASGSSGFISTDDDSSYDSDFDDLMDEMPIALGSPRKRGRTKLSEAVAPSTPSKKEYPAPPPELMNPMEGLAMFASIRADLEKVGRMIVAKKDGEKFLRRAHILASINWLAASVPTCVLDHLGQEIRQTLDDERNGTKSEENCIDLIDVPDDASEASALSTSEHQIESDDEDDCATSSPQRSFHDKPCRRVSYVATTKHPSPEKKKTSSLPFVSYFEGALLFVDISGFTKLSTMIDPENLSKIINSYFQQLVDVIFAHGGDIQKYAGDAVFAEWRATSTTSLEECVTAAAACSMDMVRECANISVASLGGKFHARSLSHSLNVHCGLGVGRLAGFHVGDNTHRREYLYLGDPIIQATEACDNAALGEVVASPQFEEILLRLGHVKTATGKHIVLASRDVVNIDFQKDEYTIKPRNAKSRGITEHVDGLHVEALIEYRRLMSLYVHPVLVSDDVAASCDFKSSARVGESRREDAELRSVYVVFINPLVNLHLTGHSEHDRTHVELVNSIMGIVSRELQYHTGHLRQCIVDDKGLVLIGTFGLRGSTFPNMVSERALPATFAISQALLMELGVKSKIGATFGDVYCGPVGGETRHEYSVMGPSCNLAARLMACPKNPGILVDNAVCKIASQSYCFNALEPVVAKGYKDPVPIFEPLTSREHTWGRIEANFVGRRDEILRLASLVNEMMRSEQSATRVAIVSSPSGVGKSSLLAHSIEHIKRALGRRRGLTIAKHAARESDAAIPFSTIRSILLSLLVSSKAEADDQSLRSGFNSAHSTIRSLGYDSLTACTAAEMSAVSESQTLPALEAMCLELNPPEFMLDHLKFHLLGTEVDIGDRKKVPTLRSIGSYIAKIMTRCCDESKLTLVAIDDIHRADAYSWQVLQDMFETTDNALIIGTSHTAADLSLRIDKDFWQSLCGSHQAQGNFVKIDIDRLSEEEILCMTMKTLALPRKDVEGSDILHEVFVQSGGTPQFANKILEGIKHRRAAKVPVGNENNDVIAEIVLHRVDSFDVAVRSTLNVAAVIGNSFSLDDVVSVFKGTNDSKEAEIRTQTFETLQFLVTEGILYCGEKGIKHVAIVDEAATFFTFYQEIWRSTVLRLVLDSRKRDIHRKIASYMEASAGSEPLTIDFIRKVFVHWKGAEDASKMASVTLQMSARALHDADLLFESIRMNEETLNMWEFSTTTAVGGFPPEVLKFVSPEELAQILAIVVSNGRLLALCGKPNESAKLFERALRIKHTAPAYHSIVDTTVIFPAYAGLCEAIASGHFEQDSRREYECNLVAEFVEATTQSHCLTIHHIHAQYLQMDLAVQQCDKGKFLAAHHVIKQTYKPDQHSAGLRAVYGKDSGALSYALCAYYDTLQGDMSCAMRTCGYVLKELYPKIETDHAQSFAIMYQSAMVLKEGGYTAQAWSVFQKAVIQPFGESPYASIVRDVYTPLSLLLALADGTGPCEVILYNGFKWASRTANLRFDEPLNLLLGRLGCCGDSMSAEICYLLAFHISDKPNQQLTLTQTKWLLAQGKWFVSKGVAFSHKHGLKSAMTQLLRIQGKLEELAFKDVKLRNNLFHFTSESQGLVVRIEI